MEESNLKGFTATKLKKKKHSPPQMYHNHYIKKTKKKHSNFSVQTILLSMSIETEIYFEGM